MSIDRLELGRADLVGDWTHPEASGLQVGHGHRQILAEKSCSFRDSMLRGHTWLWEK